MQIRITQTSIVYIYVFKPLSGKSTARNINKYIRNSTRIERKNIVKENIFQPNIRNSLCIKRKSHIQALIILYSTKFHIMYIYSITLGMGVHV